MQESLCNEHQKMSEFHCLFRYDNVFADFNKCCAFSTERSATSAKITVQDFLLHGPGIDLKANAASTIDEQVDNLLRQMTLTE